jgi:rhodanese-related sulfurtransferase
MIFLLLAILTKAEVPHLSPEELSALLARKEAVAIDVRGGVPYELGHIPNAVWMPLGVLGDRAGELPEDKLLVAYCTCKAEETSLEAAVLLSKLGFSHVAVLRGGYPGWTAANFATEAREAGEPPAAVTCKSGVQSYSGPVTHYRRLRGKTVLIINGETITLHHRGTDDPSRFFLFDGTPFRDNDWNRLETRKGEVRPGLAATAWVCAGGDAIVDWKSAN